MSSDSLASASKNDEQPTHSTSAGSSSSISGPASSAAGSKQKKSKSAVKNESKSSPAKSANDQEQPAESSSEALTPEQLEKARLKREKRRVKNQAKKETKKRERQAMLKQKFDEHASSSLSASTSARADDAGNAEDLVADSMAASTSSHGKDAKATKPADDEQKEDNESEEWNVDDGEDDSRPKTHSKAGEIGDEVEVYSVEQLSTATQQKLNVQDRQPQAKTNVKKSQQIKSTFVSAPASTRPVTQKNKHSIQQQQQDTAGATSTRPVARHLQPGFVPPAFAATAPLSLSYLYDEPGSWGRTDKVDGTRKMCIRVSMRPLPELTKLPEVGWARKTYRDSMGVVQVNHAYDPRLHRRNQEDIKPAPGWMSIPDLEVSFNAKGKAPADGASRKKADKATEAFDEEDETAPALAHAGTRAVSFHPAPHSFVSALEFAAETFSPAGSTAASTSVPTPPIISHGGRSVETTFYSTSPPFDNEEARIRPSALISENKQFMPASTATIDGAALIKQRLAEQFSQARPAAKAVHPPPPYTHAPSATMGHPPHHMLYPAMPGHHFQPQIPYGYSQPFYAPDGSVWILNEARQPMPFYGFVPTQNYPQAVVVPNMATFGNMKHLRTGQPFDSPPYSPHEMSLHPISRPGTTEEHSHPLSASASMQGAYPASDGTPASQYTPAFGAHMTHGGTVEAQPAPVHPVNTYPAPGSFTYDPETGLATDHTGLVFPHQPVPGMEYANAVPEALPFGGVYPLQQPYVYPQY